MNRKMPVVIFLVLCCHARAEGQKDYISEMMKFTDETQRMSYVQTLETNEVWLMTSQAFDKGWDSYSAGAILGAFFGDNWDRNTPSANEIEKVIQDKSFNPKLRGALAASGFEIGRVWKTEDKLQYFDSASSLLSESDIPASEKSRIAEYSYRAFSICLSEVRSLSDTNATKLVLLKACHSRAQNMTKALSATVEENPQEYAQGAMAKALEDYASVFEKWQEKGRAPESVP